MTERGLPKVDASLACPFVAYEDDRDARSDHADHRHRCYAEVRPAPRATAHQETYCLTAAFGACPTFQDWARREAARVRWPSSTQSAGALSTQTAERAALKPIPALTEPSADLVSADASASGGASIDRPAAAAAGLAASRFLRPEDLGEETPQSRDRRTWAAPPPWSPGQPGEPGEPGDSGDLVDPAEPGEAAVPEAPTFLTEREPPPASSLDDRSEQELLPAVEEWPDPEPVPAATRRRRRERLDADAPSWEQPRRYEAYPTLKARVAMPNMSRPFVGLLVLVVAAAALFLLPGFFLNGTGGGGTTASPSPSPSATPIVSPSPEPSTAPLVYVVKKGDTMTKIAKAHGVTLEALLEANKATVKDPNKVKVGAELIIPPPPSEASLAPETSPSLDGEEASPSP